MIRSFTLLILVFIASSCFKGDPEFDFTTRVTFKTQHHENPVTNIKVYLQYDATVFPGYDDLSVFDTMIVSDEHGDVTFPKVPFGKHWVVGFGEDDLLLEPVRGGLPFEIVNIRMPWDTTLYVSEY